jgi:hypothetical protein
VTSLKALLVALPITLLFLALSLPGKEWLFRPF